jgi:RNA polymerase sigma-70 factor (ECF subfamily)
MQNISEPELIAQTLDGDNDAYAELVDRYKNAVYYHCFAVVRDADVAADMAQETFISAYYKLASYDADRRLSTWFFTISTNKCLNHIKATRKVVAADDNLIASLVSHQAGPHARAEHAELHAAVKNLTPKYRAVISLYYWQGLDYAETAVAMGAPVNSVRVWLKRAKESLRKELQ